MNADYEEELKKYINENYPENFNKCMNANYDEEFNKYINEEKSYFWQLLHDIEKNINLSILIKKYSAIISNDDAFIYKLCD